jgi:hypothetical protein
MAIVGATKAVATANALPPANAAKASTDRLGTPLTKIVLAAANSATFASLIVVLPLPPKLAPPPRMTDVADGAATATSKGNIQLDSFEPISAPNAPLGFNAEETTTAASAAAIGNRFAYRAARSPAGGNAFPSLLASVAAATVALAVVSRNDDDMTNQTPTKPRPISNEAMDPENSELVPFAAAAVTFALATIAGPNAATLAALKAATIANAPPSFTKTALQNAPPAGDCASHANK